MPMNIFLHTIQGRLFWRFTFKYNYKNDIYLYTWIKISSVSFSITDYPQPDICLEYLFNDKMLTFRDCNETRPVQCLNGM